MKTINDVKCKENNTLVIYTTGGQLNINFDGDSRTGKWKVRTSNIPDNIIIYHKNNDTDVDATIYKGTIIKYESTDIDNRYNIIFNNTKTVGHTRANWHEFMESKITSPIVYR